MSKYTEAHIAAIQAFAADNEGKINLEGCRELASQDLFAEAGITAKSLVSKIRQVDGVEYEKVQRVTKSGAPIRRKATIVTAIEEALGVTGLESLGKADKRALEILQDALDE